MPNVRALYTGRAATLRTSTGIVPTAIPKAPVRGRLRVAAEGTSAGVIEDEARLGDV